MDSFFNPFSTGDGDGSGGGGKEGKIGFRADDMYIKQEGISNLSKIITGITSTPDLWTFVQQTYDDIRTTQSLTIGINVPCTLLCCIMHRPDVEIEGEGWTKIIESPGVDPENRNQRITVWSKNITTPGEYTVIVNNLTEERSTMKLITLENVSSFDVIDSEVFYDGPINPSTKNGKRRLYLLSSTYASGSDTPMAIVATYDGLDLQKAEELRFSVFYDNEIDKDIVPTFNYFYTPFQGGINLVTLDIEEVS